DLLGVKFDPALVAKFVEPAAGARALLGVGTLRGVVVGRVVGRQFGVDRLVVALCRVSRAFRLRLCVRRLGVRLAARVLLVFLLVGLLLGNRLADRHAIVEAEHDDDGVRLFGGEDGLGGRGPIGRFAARLILDQAGRGLVLADHAHVGLLGIGVFETIAEPVGH